MFTMICKRRFGFGREHTGNSLHWVATVGKDVKHLPPYAASCEGATEQSIWTYHTECIRARFIN